MGAQVSSTTKTMYPSNKCSAPDCRVQCCQSSSQVRHLSKQEFAVFVQKVHPTARSCYLCSEWYCRDHKKEYLAKRTKKYGDTKFSVYKCPDCLKKTTRKTKSGSNKSGVRSVTSSISSTTSSVPNSATNNSTSASNRRNILGLRRLWKSSNISCACAA